MLCNENIIVRNLETSQLLSTTTIINSIKGKFCHFFRLLLFFEEQKVDERSSN